MATKNGGVSMMHFISYCSSKCYENTDGQPGGHRSRRGRGPRMAWPPSAVLEGGAHKRSAVGRIAPKGRTSRGPLPAGDRPTCESVPFRPDALRRHPGVTLPEPAGERKGPISYLRRDAVTCGRTKKADSVRRQGQMGAWCGPGRAHRSIGRYLWAQKGPFLSTPCHQCGPVGSGVVTEWADGIGRLDRAWRPLYAPPPP